MISRNSSTCNDKWVLSSAVQKLIRRAETDRALEVAFRLEHVSPGYLRRRLPVIAMEEVGAADAHACLRTFGVCSGAAHWRDPTDALHAAMLALVTSLKSRVACDAECLSICDTAVGVAKQAMQSLSFEELRLTAGDTGQNWSVRIAALQLLCGLSGVTKSAVLETRAKVAAAFGLHADERALFLTHRSDVNPMVAMLPLAYEALSLPREVIDSAGLAGSDELVRGVPLFALDMYCRAGRKAIGAFCERSHALRPHRRHSPSGAAFTQAVSMAVFHLDSSRLVREVVTSGTRGLKDRIETFEMARHGVGPGERPDFYAALAADAHVLNSCRAAVLRDLR